MDDKHEFEKDILLKMVEAGLLQPDDICDILRELKNIEEQQEVVTYECAG